MPCLGMELVHVERLWDVAAHNAFTDLVVFRDRLWCCFREATAHHSWDGSIRLLSSSDGRRWEARVQLIEEGADLRDPKLLVTRDGALQLSCARARQEPTGRKVQSIVYDSPEGETWSAPRSIGDANIWLWRITLAPTGQALSIGYAIAEPWHVRLYEGPDLAELRVVVPRLFEEGKPSEHGLAFGADGKCYCLLRRDSGTATAQLGMSEPPYRSWDWKDLGVRIGGPCLKRLSEGSLIAAVRLYESSVHTALCQLDPGAGRLTERLALPSSGDTSYPGLAFFDGALWVSYYSSHEGKTAIYLARVRIDAHEQ
jgi:hypothetical protein